MRAIAAGAALMAATAAAAGGFESPPSFTPGAALGSASKGANYQVLNPVTSDGFLRHYTVRTTAGDFEVTGDQLMAARVRELDALQQLDEVNVASKFGQQVVKRGLSPLIFAGNLIASPVQTTQNTVAGVGQFFNGIGAGFNNFGKSRDDVVTSLTGQAKQKRELAAALGVDPYTDFPPLAAKLDQVAGAGAAGSLAASGAFAVAPGIAGLVASNVSTANTLLETVADYSSAQLMDMNREKLARLGVSGATADRLFANPYLTPLDDTAIAEALGAFSGAQGLDALVAGAASADSRPNAYFVRRQIELAAAWQKRHRAIGGFAETGDPRFPVGRTANGLVGVYPIDVLSWTPETERILKRMSAAGGGRRTLVITGTATPLARSNLRALGWTLEERARL